MRLWLSFGVGIGIALALMTFLDPRSPEPVPSANVGMGSALAPGRAADSPRPANVAPAEAPAVAAPADSAAAIAAGAAAAAGSSAASGSAAAAEGAARSPGERDPAEMLVARIVDRSLREPAAGLAEALSLADGALRERAVRAVLAAWSPEYPDAATAYFESLPTFAERAETADLFARVLAARDPYAALEWLRALKPPIAEAEKRLVASIEAVPAERAIEILRETAAGEDARAAAVARLFAFTLEIVPKRVAALADATFALPPSETAEQLLGLLVAEWADADPVAVMEWLVERSAAMPASVFIQAATRIGAHDANTGGSYSDRVPYALRNDWVKAVAAGHASVNPAGAARWIRRYTGDPAYPHAVYAVAEPLATLDGAAAARLVEGLDLADGALAADRVLLAGRLSAIAGIAAQWSKREPQPAARWAESLPTLDERAAAVGFVAREWAAVDVEQARAWALALPRDAARDRALVPFVTTGWPRNYLNDQVLAAFSDSAARAQAMRAVTEAARERLEREALERRRPPARSR